MSNMALTNEILKQKLSDQSGEELTEWDEEYLSLIHIYVCIIDRRYAEQQTGVRTL